MTKPALTALKKFEEVGVCWLCSRCRPNVSSLDSGDSCCKAKLDALSEKVSCMEDTLRQHMKLMEQAVKEQEKSVSNQTKAIEDSFKMEQQQKQLSFAEIVKGSCKEMMKEVTTKLDTVSQHKASVDAVSGQNKNEVAGLLDSFLDKEQRKMNLVIHNMDESSGADARERARKDADKFKTMVREGLKLVVNTTKCFRVGKKKDDKPRLLIITLEDLDTKHEILRNARDLRNSAEYDNIYITPDMTKLEREQGKKTRDELAQRRNAGEKDLVIFRGKIIKRTYPRKPSMTGKAPTAENNQEDMHENRQRDRVTTTGAVPTSAAATNPQENSQEQETTGAVGNVGQVSCPAGDGEGIFGVLTRHSAELEAGGSQTQVPSSRKN